MSALARVLFVDDEPRLLAGLMRTLAGSYAVQTAGSGPEALELIEDQPEPFAVIVSDMMMPGMSGAGFLALAHPLTPDSVLVILSGQADLSSTVAAVNDSSLFRFLAKPCSPNDLRRALDDAVEQHRLVLAERELLERTLTGAVEMLVSLMAIANPEAFGRTSRVSALVEAAAPLLGLDADWQLPVAASLSQVGCIAVPESILERVRLGVALSDTDRVVYDSHPGVASGLVVRIPRLDHVAGWIAGQPTSDTGPRRVAVTAETLLHAAVAFVAAHDAGAPAVQVSSALRDVYPPELLHALRSVSDVLRTEGAVRGVSLAEVRIGMVLDDAVLTSAGAVLVRGGETVTKTLLVRLRNFAGTTGVVEPIRVLVG